MIKQSSRERTKKLALTALFTALIAVGAFIRIPIMTVPFTMQFLFTNLAGILLGVKYGTLSLVIYLVLGLAGVPIFTSGGGIGYVFQPTFGFLIGFTVGAFVSALICSKGRYSFARLMIASLVNLVIVYSLGMIYFDLLMKYYFHTPKDGGWILVNLCLIFLPMDTVWCVVASVVAKRLLPVIYKNDALKMNRISIVREFKNKVLSGGTLSERQARKLKHVSLSKLCSAADEIRERFCGNKVDLCAIVNAKNGGCGENCKFCAQSACYSNVEKGTLISESDYITACDRAKEQGLDGFSAVTSGRALADRETDEMCSIYKKAHDGKIRLCASHGLLTKEQFAKLKESGVDTIHNNLETSERFFPSVCTSHTYQDKVDAIKAAQSVGLNVCSGCLIGMGENMDDRIALAAQLRKLNIKSVPVNILHPIEGTPLQDSKPLSYDEIRRTVAIFRFMLPDAFIRIAAGRKELPDNGKTLFAGGANAAITGDLLTTEGVVTQNDKQMFEALGMSLSKD